jgi:hypothetical protein
MRRNLCMEEKKEITEEFIRNEANTELDAIHPRFMEAQDAQVVREYEMRNYYYCEPCQLFFAPTFRALKAHFNGDMVEHRPYASCIYCQGSVFEYRLNNERKLHHNCSDYKREEDETSSEVPETVGVAQN